MSPEKIYVSFLAPLRPFRIAANASFLYQFSTSMNTLDNIRIW